MHDVKTGAFHSWHCWLGEPPKEVTPQKEACYYTLELTGSPLIATMELHVLKLQKNRSKGKIFLIQDWYDLN